MIFERNRDGGLVRLTENCRRMFQVQAFGIGILDCRVAQAELSRMSSRAERIGRSFTTEIGKILYFGRRKILISSS